MSPSPLSTDRPTSTAPDPSVPTHHHHHPTVHSFYPVLSPTHISDNFIHAFSGATAGLASGIFTCPLDVIKTKLQAQGGFGRPGGPTMILTEEGIRGMYRGLGPIILGYLPTWAVYFSVYERCKLQTPDPTHQWLTHILSAMVAGGSSTICTNPIWVIKTRLMSQASHGVNAPRAPWHYKGTLDAAKKMYMHEGIGAFYSGLGPALLGLTHVAVQFPLYEKFKELFEVDFWGVLAASVMSKICASSATYPHEVLRTRLQTQFRPNGNGRKMTSMQISMRTAKTVYMEEGWRAFYAGMGTNMIRAVPASAMTLLTYEMCSKYLLKWKRKGMEAAAAAAAGTS
ncbi:mitochondrial carrier domain-containing protein [Kalaharituber pfeilii]|nr:mitochondrial carrier domain-containing protein [Kalaharituber pfeilii]